MKNEIINQSGRSMIEMLGVLAIVGVLSVGGIAGYSKAMQKYRTNKTIEQVTQIINGVRTLYSGQKNYDGIAQNASGQWDYGSSLMKKAKILPESAWDSTNGSPKSPFGGDYTLRSQNNNKAVKLALNNIPDDACIELATQDWGAGEGLYAVAVNSVDENTGGHSVGCPGADDDSAVLTGCAGGSTVPLPIPMDRAVNHCIRGNNSIFFLFY